MDLTKEQQETLLGKIQAQVSDKYFDPAFDRNAWDRIVQRHRPAVGIRRTRKLSRRP